jgi:hypothetical protein
VNVGSSPQPFIHENEGWWFRKHINISEDALKGNPEVTFKGVDDNALVYVNGRLAVEHKGWDKQFSFFIGSFAKPGENVIAIYVQNLEGQGGIYKPVTLNWGIPSPVKAVLEFHQSLNGALAGWTAPIGGDPITKGDFADNSWKTVRQFPTAPPADKIAWYRGEFTLPNREGWIIPWRLHVESTGNMQIWLNGRLLGRYFSEGPQKDFYLPGSPGWLSAKGKNTIALVLRPSSNGIVPPSIKSLYVAPYDDYVAQEHTLNITFK